MIADMRRNLPQSLVLACLIWVLLPLLDPDTEAVREEKARIHLQKEGQERVVRGEIDIAAPPATIWDILTDYDRLEFYVSGIEESRVLSRPKEGEARIEQVFRTPVLMLRRKIRVVLKVSEHAPGIVAFSSLKGDFETYSGSWEIQPRRNRMRLRGTVRLRARFFTPGFVLDRFVRDSMRQALEGYRQEALHRQKAPP
jgi:carbon monoxide dehydrogenase subunit G